MVKLFSILTAIPLVLAIVLRWFVPDNVRIPGGWPPGNHWYRADAEPFRFCLGLAIAAGLLLLIAIATHSRSRRAPKV